MHLPLKENAWSRHERLFEEKVGKTKMEKVKGLRILKMRVRELFTHGEGISTPRAHHKGRQPSIKYANMTSKLYIFPLYVFYVFSLFIFFYVFGVDKGYCPCSYVSSSAMRKSYVCSSLRIECWLNYFFIFF